MCQTSLPLHAQFDIARLKLHLKNNPEQAQQIAVDQFTYYLEALEENRKLEQKLQSPSLVSFEVSNTKIQNEYDDLREEHKKLLNAYARLQQKNQNLMKLIDTPNNDNSPLTSFLKRFFKGRLNIQI
ncbi:MAG: hypothetical protein QNJ18_08745 [Xenococcaceae cyanobacterium MO_167.B52]|nr:hypothetical protein [Xenococcaceae cyanobacterium MO_167.B52]